MAKTNYFFSVKKNLDTGGAWLAIVSDETQGPILKAAAVSSAAPAKRWAAEQIDRSRLPWEVSEDGKSMTAVAQFKEPKE